MICNVNYVDISFFTNASNTTTKYLKKLFLAKHFFLNLSLLFLFLQNWGSTQQFCHQSMLRFHHLTTKSKTTENAHRPSIKEDKTNDIKSKMADLLGMQLDAIDTTQPMIDYGVDSLVALELVNWAITNLDVTISQLDILGGMSIADLLKTQ
jgi:aryl carrier-like protein